MLKRNSELRAEASGKLQDKWFMAALATLLFSILSGNMFSSFSGSEPGMFLGGLRWAIFIGLPISYGYAILMLDVYRDKKVEFNTLFDGFRDYERIFLTSLIQTVYTLLWTLLLIIPGVIKSYSYAMTSFILRDEPEMRNNAAIEKSMAMMEGHKLKLFLLDLSFIGWFILSCLTLGIGLLFLQPYVNVAHAAFYEDLKAQQIEVVE